MKLKNMTVKKWIALILKIALAVLVAVFAGAESLNFFNFVFPPSQWYLAYTGFGLTMGAMFVYLYLLLNDAETPLQRTIAFIMMLVGLAGELAAAGFGMQIEGWKKLGFQLTGEDYEFMILAVRIAMVIHGLALMAYWTGDQIIELLKDDDKDGKPNYRDNDYKKNKHSNNQIQSHNAPVSRQEAPRAPQQQQTRTAFTISDLEQKSNMSLSQIIAQYPEKKAFKSFASEKFDHVDGENLHQLWMAAGGANPTQAATANNNHRR